MAVGTVTVFSRSGHESFLTCRRKFYYNYLYGGAGWTKKQTPMELAIGLAVHAGMEALFRGKSSDEALEETEKTWASYTKEAREANPNNTLLMSQLEEGSYLSQAFILAWLNFRAEEFHNTYEILQVEEELRVPLDICSATVTLAARCDAILRDRSTKDLWVLNHKTCKDWDSSTWKYDIQMWMEPLAAEHHFGEPCRGTIINAFRKGRPYQGLLNNPLIYGYTNGSDWSYTSKPGWKKIFIPQTSIDWQDRIRKIPEAVIDTVLPRSLPVYPPTQPILTEWLTSITRWQLEIAYYNSDDVSQEERLNYFEARRCKFTCASCEFSNVCFGQTDIDTVINDGLLQKRIDHHATAESS